MAELTNEQLNSLSKEALIILVSSLQDQLSVMQEQLSKANASLADNSRQIEFLTQQIMLMNQRHFGRKSEQSNQIEGQLTLFDSFNEAEALESPSVPEPEIQEVVISSYKRASGKRIWTAFLPASSSTDFPKKSWRNVFQKDTRNFRRSSTSASTSSLKPLLLMNITYTSMLRRTTPGRS